MEEQRLPIQNDEIELIDLIRVLFKRKKMIIGTTLLITALAVALCFILPSNYEYSSMVTIGKTLQGGGQKDQLVLIENPETVIAKLNGVYTPIIKAQILNDDPSTLLPKITVKNPKNSNLIEMHSKAQRNAQLLVSKFHKSVIDLLVADHAGLIKGKLLRLDVDIAQAKIELEKLQDPLLETIRGQRSKLEINKIENSIKQLKDTQHILKNRLLSMADKKKLLEQQLTELDAVLQQEQKNRSIAVGKIDSESQAMTLLMLDRQIEQDRTRQIDLRDHLLFKFDEQKQQLEQQIEDNIQNQNVHKNSIAELRNGYLKVVADNKRDRQLQQQKIAGMQELRDLTKQTKMISLSMMSIQAISPKKPLIVALGFMLGLIGSVILAFLREYLQQHKLDIDQQS